MSEAILDHGGTLVAYMGDGIMAVFGAPLQQDDHADRALAAARDMLEPPGGLQRLAARGGPARGLQDGHRPQQRAGDVRQRRLRAPARVHRARRHDEHRRAPGGHDQGHAAPALHRRHDQQTLQRARPTTSSRSARPRSAGARRRCMLWSLRDEPAPAGRRARRAAAGHGRSLPVRRLRGGPEGQRSAAGGLLDSSYCSTRAARRPITLASSAGCGRDTRASSAARRPQYRAAKRIRSERAPSDSPSAASDVVTGTGLTR